MSNMLSRGNIRSVFRLRAKSVLLTYTHLDVQPQELLQHLQSFPIELTGYIICREQHADGHPHLHAVCVWVRQLSTRDPRYFDYTSGDTICHPNIQALKYKQDISRSILYCKKDNNFITSGLEKYLPKKTWSAAVAAPTKDEFFSVVKQQFPREWVLQWDKIQQYALHAYAPAEETYQTPLDLQPWSLPSSISDWFNTEFQVS